ncbi:TetR/AcrR family transcriptional regulator [Nocardioides mangrovicus]|uniref:TetR/AcrR family transcriptional regulator n=1 Tax=Nocardioides mangrovicus TaxID=2478913 RepID=A0A3L8P7G1_9ACTN|nr:TetR/AcrR family transcriptional regulator [Nocardioides mangrovicus]RLV51296.1 TetR/AcrR family transcriptional regulator [Nocardioides mangrovicus]
MTPVRPRVEGDREGEILDAALELLIEVGYDRLTMDAVAKASRASKATLYRRWETKQALVIDALVRAKGAPEVELPPDTGSLRGDLLETFCGTGDHMASEATKVLGAVCTALTSDAALAAEFRERFIGPKVDVSTQLYARAIERGEIDADADLEVIAPAMAGILLHRAFVLGLPLDDDVVRRVVDHVILPAVLRPQAAPVS